MTPFTPPVKTIGEFCQLMEFFDKIDFDINLIPYETLSNASREDICKKLGLSTTLPKKTALIDILSVMESGCSVELKQYMVMNAKRLRPRGTLELLSFLFFIRQDSTAALFIFADSEWNVISNDKNFESES